MHLGPGCVTFVLFALILVAWVVTPTATEPYGIPVIICPSLSLAKELAYRACADHGPCRDLYDLSDPGSLTADTMDKEDYEFEKIQLSGVLLKYDMVVPWHQATRKPNLIAPSLYPEIRRQLLSPPHFGSLYYDTSGRTGADFERELVNIRGALIGNASLTPIAGASGCGHLLENPYARMIALAPTINLLLSQRTFLDANAICTEFNMRPVLDPTTDTLHCQCPKDKVCGPPAVLHTTIIGFIVAALLLIVAIVLIGMITSAVRVLDFEYRIRHS